MLRFHDRTTLRTTANRRGVFQRADRGLVGTLDEEGRRDPRRRRTDRQGLRSIATATSAKRDTWPHGDTSGNRDPADGTETRPGVELRNAGTRSTRQPGLSDVHTDRRGEGSGCEDDGSVGPSFGPGNHRTGPCPDYRDCARKENRPRPTAASGYNSRGNQHSLSDR